MTSEITLAMSIAQGVAVWHMVVALYLVRYAKEKTLFLMGVALLKALLGALIYLVVLEPKWVFEAEWVFVDSLDGVLLPMTLVVLGLISMVLTWALWQLYEIGGPLGRLVDWIKRRRQ